MNKKNSLKKCKLMCSSTVLLFSLTIQASPLPSPSPNVVSTIQPIPKLFVNDETNMNLKHSYKLFTKIQQRFMLAEQVAAYKYHHQLPIYVPEIEKKILTELKSQAITLQLDDKTTARFIALLMQTSVKLQENLTIFWKTQPNIKLEIQDLDKKLRPQIKQLTIEILQEIMLAIPELKAENKKQLNEMMMAEINVAHVSAQSKTLLLNALLNIKEFNK